MIKKSATKTTTTQPAITAAQARNRWVMLIHKWAVAAAAKGFTLFKVGTMTPAFKCPGCGKPQALLFTKPARKGLAWRFGCPGCNHTTAAVVVTGPIEPDTAPLVRAINRALTQ